MVIESLAARDFRNLGTPGPSGVREFCINLSSGVNILSGGNAQGKTNVVEAVYFCATARSHRTSACRELIRTGAAAAALSCVVAASPEGPIRYSNRLDMTLRSPGRSGFTKAAAVNGLPIGKLGELFGLIYCVIFSPEDLALIKSGPGERRRFLDMELCQVSKIYYYELKQYYTVLKQRNSLLKTLQRGGNKGLAGTLEVWDAQLSDSGVKLINYRQAYIDKINRLAGQIHTDISGETLTAHYRPSVAAGSPAAFAERLYKNHDRDIMSGTTGLGIHKDDVAFTINGMDSRMYGSQGQQRTAALSLKLAELDLIRAEKNENPVLLLDDVFSELDGRRQDALLSAIGGLQTVITCTGAELLHGKIKDAVLFNVQSGQVTQRQESL